MACVPKEASSGIFRRQPFSGWVSLPFREKSKAGRGGVRPEAAVGVVTVVVLRALQRSLGE